MLIIDVDNKNGKNGDAALEGLCDRFSWKPETFTVKTGGGGRHFYFQQSHGTAIASGTSVFGSGLDIRADGGFVVAPPSLHASGIRYRIETPRAALAPLPESILALLVRRGRSRQDDGPFLEGMRNVALTRIAGGAWRKGATEADLLKLLLSVNQRRCAPPLAHSEVEKIAQSVATYPAGPRPRAHIYWKAGDMMDNLYNSGVMATLSLAEQAVLNLLTIRCRDGETRVLYSDIKRDCAIGSDATVRDALARFRELDLLEIKRGFNKAAGWRTASTYRLTPNSPKFRQYVADCHMRFCSSSSSPPSSKELEEPPKKSTMSGSTVLH